MANVESPKAYKGSEAKQGRKSMDHEMEVVKRNGTRETISFDKITKRIRSLGKNLQIDPLKISQKVIENLYDGVSTSELDELTAQQAASMCLEHPDHSMLAGNVASSNHQKNTSNSFFKTMKMLYEATDINDQHSPIISKELFDVIKKHKKEIEDAIDYERDFLYDFFGFQTLKRSYLLKIKGEPVERVQHMLMRVSLGIHTIGGSVDLQAALETYDLMSRKMFTHATPTLFNSGTPKPQLSSCFLLGMEDSITGIFKTLTDVANISKAAGGCGVHTSDIRARGSYIAGTNGFSNGLVPMYKVYNHVARFVDQCLTPCSRLLTKDGFRSVGTLQPNDQILSDSGDLVEIERILEHKYTGNVLEIETANGFIKCTPEHPILVARIYKNSVVPHEQRTPYYRSASELLVGDFMANPRPRYQKDVKSLGIEDCEFIGIIIEFGELTDTGGTLKLLPEDALSFSIQYLTSRGLHHEIDSGILTWTTKSLSPLLPFTRTMLFDRNTTRLAGFFRHLPEAKLTSLTKWLRNSTMQTCETLSYVEKRLMVDSVRFEAIISIRVSRYEGFVYNIQTNGCDGFVSQVGIVHGA